jgi:hypothetical protein
MGSVEDVRRELSRAFPGVRFTLVTHQSPVEAGLQFSIFLRLWIALFSQRVRYPHWAGTFESGKGLLSNFILRPIRQSAQSVSRSMARRQKLTRILCIYRLQLGGRLSTLPSD